MPKKVAIIEDEAELAALLEYNLGRQGLTTRVISSSKGAVEQLEIWKPDLIILDVMLPDINGQAVCELIRADPTMADIKIICISGLIEEDKIAELRTSGADDFLHKPLDIDELIRRVCRLLDIETGPTG